METARLRYFAACNSEEGFHSFYREVFTEDLTNIYIIKGGPGTGKSSLMRRVADVAERKGYRIEEIYCSSDPRSLDGVLAYGPEKSFAVLDGTAPHVTEMELPGARDEILYIGDFWSAERLREQKDLILKESRMRSDSYRRLYRYLQAAGQCARNMESAVLARLNENSLREKVSHILSRYPVGTGFSQKTMLLMSIGMSGSYRFPTFEACSDTVYAVCDFGEIGYHLYNELVRQAQQRYMRVWVSYDPLIPSRMNGVCFPDCHLAFVSSKDNLETTGSIHRIFMKQFVDMDENDMDSEMAVAEKCRNQLMGAAFDTLRYIRDLHFSVESKYISAMDFDAMRQFIDRWIEKILI